MFRDVHQSNGCLWLKPKWNCSGVFSLFSFRMGGVSASPYTSLNMGLHVGDDTQNVLLNRELCAHELRGDLTSWVNAEQVHGNQISCVDESYRGSGAFSHETAILGVDGLITDRRDITLAVLAADCVPILFYDPVRGVIATAHSGWKGTLSHISSTMVRTMADKYKSKPSDIRVILGPSIRKCCYEVSATVALPMMEQFGNKVALKGFYIEGHWYLGLQDCIRQDLRESGIKEENIDDCGICTGCHVPYLFSHRKENGHTGRLVGAIRLSV